MEVRSSKRVGFLIFINTVITDKLSHEKLTKALVIFSVVFSVSVGSKRKR